MLLTITLLLGLATTGSALPTHASESASLPERVIKLRLDDRAAAVDGVPVTLSTAPMLLNGITMVPLRFITDSLGVDLIWDPSTRNISISSSDKQIELTVDKSTALVNGSEVQLDQPAVIRNQATLVPARFIAENFDRTVTYDRDTGTVTIIGKQEEKPHLQKLTSPSVDNLTTIIGEPEMTIRFLDGSGVTVTNEKISSFVSDSGSLVYMIEYGSNHSKINKYTISFYDQKASNGRELAVSVDLDKAFDFQYKNTVRETESISYQDLIPKKLFYDEKRDTLYMLAAVERRDVQNVFYEILPEVKLITYDLDTVMSRESTFFATLDGEKFYYSNDLQRAVYAYSNGQIRTPSGSLTAETLPKLASLVYEGAIYLLDQTSKTIAKMDPYGNVIEVAKLQIGDIRGVAARDGFFYLATGEGFYRADMQGKVEAYALLDELSYTKGLYDPLTRKHIAMLPGVAGYYDFPQNYSDFKNGERNPTPIRLKAPVDFAVDVAGNIVMYDADNRLVRRINIYQSSDTTVDP